MSSQTKKNGERKKKQTNDSEIHSFESYYSWVCYARRSLELEYNNSSARFECDVMTHLLDIKMTSTTIQKKICVQSCLLHLNVTICPRCVSKFIAEYLAIVSFCLRLPKIIRTNAIAKVAETLNVDFFFCNFEISAQ